MQKNFRTRRFVCFLVAAMLLLVSGNVAGSHECGNQNAMTASEDADSSIKEYITGKTLAVGSPLLVELNDHLRSKSNFRLNVNFGPRKFDPRSPVQVRLWATDLVKAERKLITRVSFFGALPEDDFAISVPLDESLSQSLEKPDAAIELEAFVLGDNSDKNATVQIKTLTLNFGEDKQ